MDCMMKVVSEKSQHPNLLTLTEVTLHGVATHFQGSHFPIVTKFHDFSIIFPVFFTNFQV